MRFGMGLCAPQQYAGSRTLVMKFMLRRSSQFINENRRQPGHEKACRLLAL
jgi:hypothetical protein